MTTSTDFALTAVVPTRMISQTRAGAIPFRSAMACTVAHRHPSPGQGIRHRRRRQAGSLGQHGQSQLLGAAEGRFDLAVDGPTISQPSTQVDDLPERRQAIEGSADDRDQDCDGPQQFAARHAPANCPGMQIGQQRFPIARQMPDADCDEQNARGQMQRVPPGLVEPGEAPSRPIGHAPGRHGEQNKAGAGHDHEQPGSKQRHEGAAVGRRFHRLIPAGRQPNCGGQPAPTRPVRCRGNGHPACGPEPKDAADSPGTLSRRPH